MTADSIVDAHAASHVDACDGGMLARLLARCLHDDELDAAIDAGLMAWVPCMQCRRDDAALDAAACVVVAAQARLQTAWAARERYRAREARLRRRIAERAARRAVAAQAVDTGPPALPPAAAAALARAKAKAAGRP